MEQWKEIEPGSSYRVSDLGNVRHGLRHISCFFTMDQLSLCVKIENQSIDVAQLVVAVFMYNDLSIYSKLNLGFKDKNHSNCALENIYVKEDPVGKYLKMVQEAALVCDTVKHMHEYLHKRHQYITLKELTTIKRDYKIRCGTKRKGKFTYENQTKNLDEWAQSIGMLPATLKKRLQRGWSLEKALKVPVLDSETFKVY